MFYYNISDEQKQQQYRLITSWPFGLQAALLLSSTSTIAINITAVNTVILTVVLMLLLMVVVVIIGSSFCLFLFHIIKELN